jgi:2-keto-4-pentenoate hydratase/2-oxohepta-3-ene-1,7-dioic acid hydratase in catechol pathway
VKFATYRYQRHETVGLVEPKAGQIWPLAAMLGELAPFPSMLELIRTFDEIKVHLGPWLGTPLMLSDVRLQAPIPRPARNVLCVGKNYYEHAAELNRVGFEGNPVTTGSDVPTAPIIFTKPPESVIGPGAPIRYPTGVSDSLDYEAELAVIIGRGGRGISRTAASSHVWGYTIVNDVTARDWQVRHKQWFLGKSFDTFCPMGPWIATADEIDLANTSVRCWVNDELRQDATTRDLIFDVPALIETISAGITLYPGDIIATGTPAGVGIGFTPPKYLKPGDTVRIAIAGIGTLTNPIVAD